MGLETVVPREPNEIVRISFAGGEEAFHDHLFAWVMNHGVPANILVGNDNIRVVEGEFGVLEVLINALQNDDQPQGLYIARLPLWMKQQTTIVHGHQYEEMFKAGQRMAKESRPMASLPSDLAEEGW
jgi:hypothetical protein